jgi:hypothetical protein
VKKTPAGTDILIGYLAPGASAGEDDIPGWEARLRGELPAALVPQVGSGR